MYHEFQCILTLWMLPPPFSYPLVNEQLDPGRKRAWKMSETIKTRLSNQGQQVNFPGWVNHWF